MASSHDVLTCSGRASLWESEKRLQELPRPVSFSTMYCVIEICGPTQEHVSIIDVPGVLEKTTSGWTKKKDMGMVDSMVLNFMKNPRSVILTVVPANIDIAAQSIADIAEEVDPEGLGTLGILPKTRFSRQGSREGRSQKTSAWAWQSWIHYPHDKGGDKGGDRKIEETPEDRLNEGEGEASLILVKAERGRDARSSGSQMRLNRKRQRTGSRFYLTTLISGTLAAVLGTRGADFDTSCTLWTT